jgi:hypothetical protein
MPSSFFIFLSTTWFKKPPPNEAIAPRKNKAKNFSGSLNNVLKYSFIKTKNKLKFPNNKTVSTVLSPASIKFLLVVSGIV